MPNLNGCDQIIECRSDRRGRLCRVPGLERQAAARIQTSRENSFAVRAPRLFNILPADIRDFEGPVSTFKSRLDRFLQDVPDKPCLPHYYQAATNNSLLEQVPRLGRGSSIN